MVDLLAPLLIMIYFTTWSFTLRGRKSSIHRLFLLQTAEMTIKALSLSSSYCKLDILPPLLTGKSGSELCSFHHISLFSQESS